MLKYFAAAHCQDVPAHRLSGGEAQRVALARAIAVQPSTYVFDEPFAALDIVSKYATQRAFQDWLNERPAPLLLVTHDPRDVVRFSGTVIVLENGTVTQQGATQHVMLNPQSEFAAAFFSGVRAE